MKKMLNIWDQHSRLFIYFLSCIYFSSFISDFFYFNSTLLFGQNEMTTFIMSVYISTSLNQARDLPEPLLIELILFWCLCLHGLFHMQETSRKDLFQLLFTSIQMKLGWETICKILFFGHMRFYIVFRCLILFYQYESRVSY